MNKKAPPLLTTERLTIRWIDESDVADQYALFSDPKLLLHVGTAPWTSMSQANEWMERTLRAYTDGTSLVFGITTTQVDRIVANIRLFNFDSGAFRAEVGYILDQSHHGQGIMFEAMSAILGYAFDVLELNRIEADVDPGNAPSIALLERLGFEREGLLRERWMKGGDTSDSLIFGLLRRNWQTSTDAR
jgi:ribosomal-protein-alanine N-acetyltransferase